MPWMLTDKDLLKIVNVDLKILKYVSVYVIYARICGAFKNIL